MNQQFLTKKKLIILRKFLLSLFIIFGIFSCNYEPPRVMSKAKTVELEKAFIFAEMNLPNLSDVGYVQYTPSEAASQLVQTMNSAQTLTPEEEEELRQSGVTRLPKPIPYVLNQPTGIWQVVIIGDDQNQQVIIEGYGTDLEEPLMTKTIPCCY